MRTDSQWYFNSTTTPPSSVRRIRIDGRLKSIGDTVLIYSLARNGTIVDIRGDNILVIVHHIGLNPTITIYSSEELRHGEGISTLHCAWLNGLEIYFFDPVLCVAR